MRLTALAPALALAACSPSDDAPEQEKTAAAPSSPQRANIWPVFAGEDVQQADLAGELGCSFVQDGASGPVLIAMADVMDDARAEGMMKLGPSTLRLTSAATGGFNALVRGARFTSGDLTVSVVVTSDTPVGGGEAPPLPARLEIASEANGTQVLDGEWSCGP